MDTYLEIAEKHTFQKMKNIRFFHYRTTLNHVISSNKCPRLLFNFKALGYNPYWKPALKKGWRLF